MLVVGLQGKLTFNPPVSMCPVIIFLICLCTSTGLIGLMGAMSEMQLRGGALDDAPR